MANPNPIERLLDALPSAVAKEKRTMIQAELEELGLWEHYRQTVKRGKDVGKINYRAGVVFKRHLGVTDDFIIGSQDFQEEEIKRIVKQHYDPFVSAA